MAVEKRLSLRQAAGELGISPAYLSYMVNGKRPWRADLYERYCQLVNTPVNTQARDVNRGEGRSVGPDGAWREWEGVEPTYPVLTRHNGFEVRKSHRAPSTPKLPLS